MVTSKRENGQNAKRNFHQRKVKEKNFFKSFSRTTIACNGCRKGKRKCDGQKPICGRCSSNGKNCDWYEIKGRSSSPSATINEEISLDASAFNNDKRSQSELSKVSIELEIPQTSENKMQLEKNNCFSEGSDLLKYENKSESRESGDLDLDLECKSNSLYQNNIYFPFQCFLDPKGSMFFSFFQHKAIRQITIGPDRYNHLMRTYIPLAGRCSYVQIALSSWGSLFLTKNSESTNYYKDGMVRATKQALTIYNSHMRLEKTSVFSLICFFLISMSVEICAGDTYNWKRFLCLCQNLIIEYGGIHKFLKDFSFSNEVKWILSNIQYHVDLSNDSKLHSSNFMEQYYSIIDDLDIFAHGDFGMDPSQGCLQPLYFIVRKINIEAFKLENEWRDLRLQKQLDSSISTILSRESFFKLSTDISDILASEVESCKPWIDQIKLLEKNSEDMRLHYDLFELHRMTCLLYIILRIRKLPPCVPEAQNLLMRALAKIGSLHGTRLATCIGFPILICGMTCCDDEDKERMDGYLSKLITDYVVGNFKNAVSIVKDSWESNPGGSRALNWTQIITSRGPDVCFS